jgi:hypothetical protein
LRANTEFAGVREQIVEEALPPAISQQGGDMYDVAQLCVALSVLLPVQSCCLVMSTAFEYMWLLVPVIYLVYLS